MTGFSVRHVLCVSFRIGRVLRPNNLGVHHEVVSRSLLCMPPPRLWNRRDGRHGRWFSRWWNERAWWWQLGRWERRWRQRRRERGLHHLHRGPAMQLHLGLVHPGVSNDGRVPDELHQLDLYGELQREQQLPAHLRHGRDLHAELRNGSVPDDGHDGGVGEAALQRRTDVSGHVRRGDELQADRGHRHRELHGLQLTTRSACPVLVGAGRASLDTPTHHAQRSKP